MDNQPTAPKAAKVRSTWVAPRVDQLPALTELVLQTGPAIPGGGDPGGGTTVF